MPGPNQYNFLNNDFCTWEKHTLGKGDYWNYWQQHAGDSQAKKKEEGAGFDTPMMTMTHERKKNKLTLHFLLSLFHLSPDHVFVLGHGISLSFQHMPD